MCSTKNQQIVFVKKVEDTNIKAKPKKKGDSITQMMMKAQLRKTDDEDDEKERARIYRKPGYRTSNSFLNFPPFNLPNYKKVRKFKIHNIS